MATIRTVHAALDEALAHHNAGRVAEAKPIYEAVLQQQPDNPVALHQLGLIASVRSAERSVISAVLSGSRDLALQAFATHPLVGDLALARKLLEDTLSATPSLGRLLR